MLPKDKVKRITLQEFYVGSLIERAKYPSPLVILMERIATIEGEVAGKGKPIAPLPDCHLQQE